MKHACIVLLSIGFLAFTFTPHVKDESYTGYAYEKGNSKPVYTEQFTDKIIDGRHLETKTKYFNASNKLIAERSLNFEHSKFAPDFKTEDLRTGHIEGAEANGKKIRLFFKEDKNSKLREKTITIPQPAVIDGGFNQYIKSHWSDLEKGNLLVFNFAVPSRLDYFTMRASKVEIKDNNMTVRIEPDKRLLRWIASPIIVHYDMSTKRITSYEGLSNISDENGENFTIKLVYPEKGP